MTPDEIRSCVTSETRLIDETVQALLQGAEVSLSGFDSRVADLCLATQALPLADAQSLVPDFELLGSALDNLRQCMMQQPASSTQP